MNQEDPFLAQMWSRKRPKTSAEQTASPGITILKDTQKQVHQQTLVKKKEPSNLVETKVEDKSTFDAALAAIKAIQDKKNGKTMEQKVKFAGQTFSVEREKTVTDLRKEQQLDKKRLGGGCEGLDNLVQMINDKDKNVTCMDKSKMDWDDYTKKNKLETELEQNRKDGFLTKKRFLDEVNETEYQKKKQGQKESRKITAMVEASKQGK